MSKRIFFIKLLGIMLVVIMVLGCTTTGKNKSTIIITDYRYLIPDVSYQITFQDGTVKKGKTDKNGIVIVKIKKSEDFSLIVYDDTLGSSGKIWNDMSVLEKTKNDPDNFYHFEIDYYSDVKEYIFELIGGDNYCLNFYRPYFTISQ
jgi:hypothetical protein